ncbi:amino acid ABC transporter permease [Ornithinicoccus hortensis]|uniref:Polar amino acid transport system permease protein n=1 Tax=Ornithinicoccus hortensis TaxID=82346 RepID=A0A542YWG2_9MICO|nr:amino acid ABC transporter permease [Ornithinicoccus hortensis]TQL52430.1 polar amino acid transport system permease protein [Ornithinicoccus hortensis]
MTVASTTPATQAGHAQKVVKLRHPFRWISYAVIAVLAAMLVNTLLTNENFGWDVVGEYFTSVRILDGLLKTLQLTAIAMVLGVVLGVCLAVMRLSSNPALSWTSWLYLWFFRGTPVFVQLLFWGYISALYPVISLGVPFGPEFVQFDTNVLITPVMAAILGLGLNEGAYMAEIVRAGILSVDKGQTEAAQALGMKRGRILRQIVLPQAMRVIIPPTGNNTISMLKTTSLVSVLAFPELLYAAQLIYADNFETIPLLITASIWYIIVTSVLTVGQYYIERHYSRSDRLAGGRMRRLIELQRRRGVRTEGQEQR